MAQFLSLIIISLLFFQLSPFISTSASNDIRFQLTHVDSKLNLTKAELFRRGVDRTKHRIASITNSLAATSTTNNVQAPVHAAGGGFETEISIGTPPTRISLIVDTGSSLLWTQCKPCITCYPQTYAIYDPSNSTSFSKIACSSSICQSLSSNQHHCNGTDCDYSYFYAGASFTDGFLASETFSFGSASPVSVPGLAFGCGNNNSLSPKMDVDGLMGLGRSPLSIVTQLGSGKFSYCLTSVSESNTSPLILGSSAVITGSFQSTPIVVNPSANTFYYLTLQGITVGSTLLQIPSTVFALNSDGSGGLIIDSGTTITALQYEAFGVLAQEFQSQVDLPVIDNYPLPLCFSYDQSNSTVKIPDIVFHFDGADMTIPPSNSMYNITAGVQCLAILPSGGLSILGNFQQQNMHILYDLNSNMLSFAPAQCDQI